MTFSSFFSHRALPILAVVLFLTSLHARGAVTTYEFTGTLTDIRESGAGFSYGDTFYARYTHDDAPQTGSLIESDRMLFSGGNSRYGQGAAHLLGHPAQNSKYSTTGQMSPVVSTPTMASS